MSTNKALRFGSSMVAGLRKSALDGPQRSSTVLKRSLAIAVSKRKEDGIQVKSGITNATSITTRAMSSSTQGVEEICGGQLLKEMRDQVCWITMNRPKKFNALTTDMYDCLTDLINQASDDPQVKVVVLTGNGEYYSAGNDLTNFMQWAQSAGGDLKSVLPQADKRCRDLVSSFIDCKKAFIAAVNGPAVGVPVTLLALCDLVVCSDRASFQTPFTQLGQSPEACSSVTFPAIMGMSRATRMIMFNHKMSAQEALQSGLVAEVIPHEKLYDRVNEMLYSDLGIVNNCYPNSLLIAKSLIRDDAWKARMKEVCARESVTLCQRFISDECEDALKKFFTRKNK